jgi:hypothetical protein
MTKKPLALVGALLIGTSLAACGGSSDDAYCDDLQSAASTFEDVDSGSVEKLDGAFDTFHQLAAESPEDIKDDWKVIDDAISGVEKALTDAGLTFSDLPKIQAGEMPEGADPTKLQGLSSSFAALSDEKFAEASKAIDTHATDVCEIEL